MPETDTGETRDRLATPAELGERIEAVKVLLDSYSSMSIAAATAGEPWVAKVFFVDDEPASGRLDLCSAMIVTSRKLAMLQENGRVAFVVAGDLPDRWAQGTGVAEVVEDEADADAIVKRLEEKSPPSGPFLRMVPWKAIRIHVERMKYTDIAMRPPIIEFTFA